MWNRFTGKAREVVFAAQKEAQKRNTSYVNSEHLLLGLLADEGNVACRVLQRMNISLETLRAAVEKQASVAPQTIREIVEKQTGGSSVPPETEADMQLTPRAKRIIDLSYDEARQLSNKYIGTEHLLLGLIREGEGLAGRVLAKSGVELERTRREVMALQDNDSGVYPPASASPPSPPVAPSPPDVAALYRSGLTMAAQSTTFAAEMLFNTEFKKLSSEQQQALQTDGLLLSELPPAFYVVLKVVTEAWDSQQAVVLSRNGRLRVQKVEVGDKLLLKKFRYDLQIDVTLVATLLANEG